MNDTYLTVENPSKGLFKDKGSKFIALLYPVTCVEDIQSILGRVQKEYYDARHICYAYMIGYERKIYRVNDNGEPSGTAGRPILGQINSANITDVLIVVIRYFGGILLGTSGLIQAYKHAAADAINSAVIVERIIERKAEIECGYDTLDLVKRIFKDLSITVVSQEYEIACRFVVSVRLLVVPELENRISKISFVNFKFCDDGEDNGN